jgi:DNA mismatch repair protein MutS2
MQFTEKTLRTLEFDKIRNMLAASAQTDGAKEMAMALTPSEHIAVILRNLRHTSDAKRLIGVKGSPSFGGVRDMSAIIERANKGAILTPRELLDAANVLRTSRSMLDYIRTNKLFETSLDEIFERMIPDQKTEDHIYRAIIAEDMIADEASGALGDIRRKIKATNNKIKDLLAKYTGGAYSKYLQENIVTQRGGRYVVPVRIECRNEVKGLVHDTSSSGATLFIEPMAVVDANNELRELEAAEEHEIEKILASLTAEIDTISGALRLNYQNINELAFIYACGELSFRMNGTAPMISGDRSLKLYKARHPLIDKDKVVPINIEIGHDRDTLIITGPNTGGKTEHLRRLFFSHL